MYKTKPLSLFKSHPEAASQPPPEGQNWGYLVVDDDPATDDTGCWGRICCPTRVWGLPFPQNRVLSVVFSGDLADHAVVLVPVPDQPLASNRYYAVVASGRSRGLVRTCSREEDMACTCFGCRCIKDVKPRAFDPANVYQQMEIVQRKPGLFTARAVAADGVPPLPYRYKDWLVYQSRNNKFDLKLDQEPAGPGRWYFPFFYLIKEEDGVSLRRQMDRSAFYQVVLEKRWEPVHTLGGGSNKLVSRKALIGGSVEAKQEAAVSSSRHGGDTYVWFRAAATGQRVGLCTCVWERMTWEEHRGGWLDEEEVDAEKVAGSSSVLVERFVVKRMDGSVAVAFDFVHLNKVRTN